MITSSDLIQNGLFEHPYLRYKDTRFFYPGLREQRRVLEVVTAFISDQKDPAKNLGVITGPSAGGKSMLAMKLAQTRYLNETRGEVFGLYLNTNNMTEPRHFLMAVLDTLELSSTRSNAGRLDAIFERLSGSEDQLLMVLDGPPVDQDYLTQLLSWSVEHQKRIKALIFLQDRNNITANIGSLNSFMGLYVPFRAPEVEELASLLYARALYAGCTDPLQFFSESEFLELAKRANGSLSEALQLAERALEAKLEDKKSLSLLTNFLKRKF